MRLLTELGLSITTTPRVLCDNLSAIYLTVNPILHARTKHIEVDHHFIREKVQNNTITVQHVLGTEQVADVFTKPLLSH